MKKLIVLLCLFCFASPTLAQRLEGNLLLGYGSVTTPGFSAAGALKLSFDLAPQFQAGAQVLATLSNGASNPNFELAVFGRFDQSLLSNSNLYLSFAATLRPVLKVSPGSPVALQVLLQPELNLYAPIDSSLVGFAGVGAGVQFGIVPALDIQYGFAYLYSGVRYSLSSLVMGLSVSVHLDLSLTLNNSLSPSAFGVRPYAALGYAISQNIDLIFEAGYSLGQIYISTLVPNAKDGVYFSLRGAFRL
jgi:hypothetical protein